MVPTPATVLAENPKAYPFWHAQVLGVFHAEVQHTGSKSRDLTWKTLEFLWVRWLGDEHHNDYESGRNAARLPKVGFIEDTQPGDGLKDSYAFSFLDPSLVIRAAHLIPAFNGGRTSKLLSYQGKTEARADEENDDWVNYYVNIFADRDMFMRHLGLGIGHQHCTAANPPTLAAPQDNPPAREGEDYEMEDDTAALDLPVDVDQDVMALSMCDDDDNEGTPDAGDVSDAEDTDEDDDERDLSGSGDEDAYEDM
ncbi:hypothetical protein NP233_g5228 [Leucocoprinus birnbaumii]|uniref:Uncharacterized protein n=1 Tax=Leucocoprinus birnbaumii TaxID=56174 RepID=A0AAD5VWW9_9AGAR|nr:hypothetical protein NP233_g5228 [Leucocoprinus birnbaumii]